VFDHVTIRVADRAESEAFYNTVLAPLGIETTYSDSRFAEWDALLQTPDAVLERIDQIPMEMHVFHGVTARHLEVVKKLKKHFYVVNLHYNNFACSPKLKPLHATAFEVLLVNKRLGELDTAAPVPTPMSPLNAPDNPQVADCN